MKKTLMVIALSIVSLEARTQSFKELLKISAMWKRPEANIDSIKYNMSKWGYNLKEEKLFMKILEYNGNQPSTGNAGILLAVEDDGDVTLSFFTQKPDLFNEYFKEVSKTFPLVDGNKYLMKFDNGDYILVVFDEPKNIPYKNLMVINVKMSP